MKFYFHCGLLKKNRGGVYWFRTKGNIWKAQNRAWYSKWYWNFNNAITSNDNKNDHTPAGTVTALLTTNESSNCNSYNNINVLIIKIIITIKTKSDCP